MNKCCWIFVVGFVTLGLGCNPAPPPPDLSPPEVEIEENEDIGATPGGDVE